MVASSQLTLSPFSFRSAFETQSVQLTLTACCLDPSVLNLWDYSRQSRALYPVAGQPCRDGTYTHWNKRPCPAALTVQPPYVFWFLMNPASTQHKRVPVSMVHVAYAYCGIKGASFPSRLAQTTSLINNNGEQ